MAAPTLVSATTSSINGGGTPRDIASISVQNGDVITCSTFAENGTGGGTIVASTTSGSTSAWALKAEQETLTSAGAGGAYSAIWSCTATATGTITVRCTKTAVNQMWGHTVKVWRGSAGVGAIGKSATATCSVTTTGANSAIDFVASDWNATQGAIAYTASSVQDFADQSNNANYCVYASHLPDSGATGAKTIGMSTPASGGYKVAALEILGAVASTDTTTAPKLIPRNLAFRKQKPWLRVMAPLGGATRQDYVMPADTGTVAMDGEDATLTYVSVASLPVTVTGISTAVSCAGPFSFGPIIDSQQPNFVLGTGWQAFGQVAFITAAGTKFYPTISTSVTKIRCHVVQTGTTLADDVECRIYATSAGLPTGSPLGTSAAVDGATLDTVFDEETSWVEFTFASPVAVTAGTTYAWSLWRTGTRVDTSNPNLWYCNNPPPDPRYNLTYLDAQLGDPGTWTTTTDLAATFEIHSNMTEKYFFFGRDSSTATTLVAMKSTNPVAGFSSAATKTGFTTAILNIRAHHVPNTPYVDIAIMDGTSATSVAVKYVRFDMGTETFGTTETVMAATNITGTASSGWNLDLVKRFNGEIVFAYNGPQVSTRARIYRRIRDNAGSYGTQTLTDIGSGTTNCTKVALGLGWSDAANFAWTSSGTNKLEGRWLDKDNTTISSIGGTTTTATAWGGMVFGKEPFQSNFLVCAGDNSAQITEANPPTFATETNTACLDTRRCFTDDTDPLATSTLTIYYTYIDSSTGDVFMYSSTNYGATLSSSVGSAIMTAAITQAANNLSIDGETYDNGRGNIVIPLVYNDAGTLKYNEYNIRSTGGVTHYTMPATTGTVVLAGQIADLDADRRTIGGQGTLTIAGQIATTRFGHKTVGGLGTITMAGQPAALRIARQTAGGLGTIVLGGQIADVDFDHKTTGGIGTVVIAGQANTFRRTYVMPATTGTVVLGGQAATVRWVRIHPHLTGTIVISGQAATLSYGRKGPAGTGTVVIAGQAETFKRSYVMPAGLGTVVMSGQQPVVTRYKRVMPGSFGTITIAGQANVFKRGYATIATLGTVTIVGQIARPGWGHKTVGGLGTVILGGQTATLRYGHTYIMPATTGTVTINGQDAKTAYGRKVPHTQGTITIAGQTAKTAYGRVMPAGTGTITIAGQTAITRYGRGYRAVNGVITISGQTAAMRIGRAIVALNGTLTINGQTASLQYGLGRFMPASQGNVVLSGSVVLRFAHKVLAGLGTVVIGGQPAALRYTRIPFAAGTGTVTINGQTAKTGYGRVFQHTHGTIVINGQANKLAIGHKMPAVNGTIVISGVPANLIYSAAGPKTMPAGVGVINLQGQAAITRYGRVLTAGTGTVTIAGQAAKPEWGHKTAGGLGTLVISGQIAVTRYGHKTAGGLGTVVIGGQIATLKRNRTMPAVNGTIVIAGQAATLRKGTAYRMSADTGTVVLAGQAVNLKIPAKIVMPAGTGVVVINGQATVAREIPGSSGGPKGGRGGLQPLHRRRPREPEPEPCRIPVPPFKRPPEQMPRLPEPVVDPRLIPSDLLTLQGEIFAAQDIADIEAFLMQLDQDEQDAADIAEMLSLLDD